MINHLSVGGCKGTVQNLDSGLDWTGLDVEMDWKTDVISLQEWAWLVTSFAACNWVLGLSNTQSSRE